MRSNIEVLRDNLMEYDYFYGKNFDLEDLTDENVLYISDFFLDLEKETGRSFKKSDLNYLELRLLSSDKGDVN